MQLPIMHRVSKRLRALIRDRRANTAVEFALAAPALFLFMFGIIEVGYALWMQNALDYSVAAAARLHLASIRDIVQHYAEEAGIPNPGDLAHKWQMLMAGSIVFAGYGDRSSARVAREAGALVLEEALKG